MLVKTILNRCHKFKSFVYGETYWGKKKNKDCIFAEIFPRKNSHSVCSKCHKEASGYDTSSEPREFHFVPLWGYPVFFLYHMRRVQCPSCGIKVEEVPWAKGKSHLTKVYMLFLAKWAKSLSWKEVSNRFQVSWESVYRSVRSVVEWGLKHRSLEGITAIGVDEILWRKGYKFLTVVYQIDKGAIRLLWLGKDRTEKTFSKFFDMLGESKSNLIKYVCSDMWMQYLKVVRIRAKQAISILDRFHIVARMNKALDEVRAGEHRRMKKDGYDPVLTKSRWLLLKRPENLKSKERLKLRGLLKYNLKAVRAYLLKEEFQKLWSYVSPFWAGRFIDIWTKVAMRSKIEPMKKQAKSIRQHKGLILNWFHAKKAYSSGVVEGLNNKIKVTTRKSYGFREYKSIETALYHQLGDLPGKRSKSCGEIYSSQI